MGQYWCVGNLDKKEFINPHVFGDGSKLMEFGCSPCGTLTGLTLLLADKDANGRGGGDFRGSCENTVGRWHGDRIVVFGDYGDDGLWDDVSDDDSEWIDISEEVLQTILQDEYVLEKQKDSYNFEERAGEYWTY